MDNFFSYSRGYIEAGGNALARMFSSIGEAWDFLCSAIELPLELVTLMPPILGASITIVLFVSVVKFIVGR